MKRDLCKTKKNDHSERSEESRIIDNQRYKRSFADTQDDHKGFCKALEGNPLKKSPKCG